MDSANDILEGELARLEARVDELAEACRQLRTQNGSLMERLDSLTNERASLLRKHEQTRGRVEAMISRLKSMEHNA